jgi:predicted AAA+ superfamily ATPase
MDRLIEIYGKLLDRTKTAFHRYAFADINWENRMIGITGPRGVGKTTLVLQHIKEQLDKSKALYVNADDFYFANHRILDLADAAVKRGLKYLIIDEIHKYADWSKELKLIYDYHPDLQVVFTGSSVLDIKKGVSDLSRRAVMYSMQGMSFREYLKLCHGIDMPVYSLDEIITGKVALEALQTPLLYYNKYLRKGYYPFSNENGYEEKMSQIVAQTLENDIPAYAKISATTAMKLKRLLAIIADSVPFKPNFSKLAEILSVSRNDIGDYLQFIEDAGMIGQLRDDTTGIRGLGKVQKVYLDNTSLIYSLSGDKAEIGNVRETFFLSQLRVRNEVTASRISDFVIDGKTFEIGGKNKGSRQIREAAEGYVVKDEIEYAHGNVIPLWQFGLNY